MPTAQPGHGVVVVLVQEVLDRMLDPSRSAPAMPGGQLVHAGRMLGGADPGQTDINTRHHDHPLPNPALTRFA